MIQLNKGFIDIHMHILPGLDDGAGDPSEALAMMQMAVREDIWVIIATPHFVPHIQETDTD